LDSDAGLGGDRLVFAYSALLFILSAAGTIWWCGSISDGMPMPGGWTMSMAWMRMPDQTWLDAAAMFMGMWVVMMVAMMLPSLTPTLAAYRRSMSRMNSAHPGALTALVGAAYFLVWALFGIVAYPIGVFVATTEMHHLTLARAVPLTTGIVLLLAGGFQFTPWKIHQLGCCRVTPGCEHAFAPTARSAFQQGLRLGIHCVSCCCGFMLILLVSGVMNLGAMAIVAVAITIERLAPRPEVVARVTGVFAYAAGLFLIIRALGSP
jgi:predicted metal-binding membrane protein